MMRLLVLLCELVSVRRGWCAKLVFEHWRFLFLSFFSRQSKLSMQREWTPLLDTSLLLCYTDTTYPFFFVWLLGMGKWEWNSIHCIQELPYIDYTKHNNKYVEQHIAKAVLLGFRREDKSIFLFKATVIAKKLSKSSHNMKTCCCHLCDLTIQSS